MTTYLLDSDILIDFFKKKVYAMELVSRLSKTSKLTASILSIPELRAGWDNDETEFFLPRFYKLVAIENITPKIAELAGKLRREYKTKGVSLPTIDILIAATTILNKHKFVTRNIKHYPLLQLKIYPVEEN